jgi:hypothetical protein
MGERRPETQRRRSARLLPDGRAWWRGSARPTESTQKLEAPSGVQAIVVRRECTGPGAVSREGIS